MSEHRTGVYGEVLVNAEQVSKKFCRSLKRSLWYGAHDVASALLPWNRSRTLHDSMTGNGSKPELRPDEFWAVQDVSFEVRRGQCLGLVGHNGAGKSTLLKILNGLIRPDAGLITIRGRVGALIELNAGFNPILSGRENIFTEAALLGFSKEEVAARFDDIVAFAELEEFIDMPVQNYSSGMRVRLGFSIAAQMEPDVLLIDEVLAVGDVGFRAKCLSRMGALRDRCAFIFVSHSMPQVARISTNVLHLDHGRTRLLTANVPDGLASYYSTFEGETRAVSGDGTIRIKSVRGRVNDESFKDEQPLHISYGQSLEYEVVSEFVDNMQPATLQLVFWNQEMMPVVDVLGPSLKRWVITPGADGMCRTRVRIPEVTLNSGRFTVSAIALSLDGLTTRCQSDHAHEIEVASNVGSACTISVSAVWQNQ
jgi:lipopolysaccharide transport system ATP-binding protein